MTDYAPAAAEQSWNWWMTTAAAAMRMRNFRNHQGCSDQEDEYAGPESKRQRIGDDGHDEYWTAAAIGRDDSAAAAAGPLDLSVKATLTTTTAATAHIMDRPSGGRGEFTATTLVKSEYRATTPVKKSTVPGANGRSSKKAGGKTAGGGTTAAAVKSVTRKLMPQLLLDNRMDRSSPVSGTIIVPASSDDRLADRQSSSSPALSSSYTTAADCGEHDDGGDGDDYDGGDIDPEYNVVEATDEARRRIESIPNVLGPYRCRLCGVRYTDAFALARHRCRCIVHVRYRCPECDKVFQCPANLASHRRWHGTGGSAKTAGGGNNRIGKNGAGDHGDVKLEMTAVQRAPAEITHICKDGNVVTDDTTSGTVTAAASTVAITTAAGFKKNILQRAVQAAAAAANNNNDIVANDAA